MFSLLFGMGFAVMLTRAECAERDFLPPYLRRIAALAVFGAAHHIFIWGGDILFSYAVGAVALLILLYAQAKYIALYAMTAAVIGMVFKLDLLFAIAGSLGVLSIAMLFLRSEKYIAIERWNIPIIGLLFFVIGGLMFLLALGFWLIPTLPEAPRVPLTLLTVFMCLFGLLATVFHQPLALRTRRLGVGMYVLPFLMMAAFGALQYFELSPNAIGTSKVQTAVSTNKRPSDATNEEHAKRLAERIEREKEHQEDVREEKQVMTQGLYTEAVRLRARGFIEQANQDAGFAIIVVGMFLLGAWFVRSGVMENTSAHLPLFKRLALYGIPMGCGLGLIGSSIATGYVSGQPPGLYQFALGLTMLGNLPACLGYVGVLVLMLHSTTVLSKVRVLAPAGRMALTNYLFQSVIGSLFFYGYGLGYWGMGRAWQVVFVAVVFALQVVFSHIWLAKFHYGPMEWLWRSITYLKFPVMRRRKDSSEAYFKSA